MKLKTFCELYDIYFSGDCPPFDDPEGMAKLDLCAIKAAEGETEPTRRKCLPCWKKFINRGIE